VSNESQEGREALDLIGTTGAYGVEAVSSRIFEYAQYVGGDLSPFFRRPTMEPGINCRTWENKKKRFPRI